MKFFGLKMSFDPNKMCIRDSLEGAVRKLFSFGFHNDMGTRNSFCVEPPVISSRDLEGQLLILVVVFADVDMESLSLIHI